MTAPKAWTPPWEADPECTYNCIGPVKVPWDWRKFFFQPKGGSFVLTVQDFRIMRKSRELKDYGFRDKHIQNGHHSCGSPVLRQPEVRTIHEFAIERECAYKDAFLAYMDSEKRNLHPDFREAVKAGPAVYPLPVMKNIRAALGLPDGNPEYELRVLQDENKILSRQKEIDRLRAENAKLKAEQTPIVRRPTVKAGA